MSLPGRVLRPPTSCSSRLARTSLRAVSPPTPLPRLTALQRSLHQTYCSQQAIVSGASSGQTQSRSISSSEFDPPAQISKINTHYCREPQLVVIEGYGILQGQMDPSRLLTKYLNIPFASVQDPIKHAVAPESWAGIRDATVLGPMCPQKVQHANSLTTMMLGLPGPGFEFSERDCLNLNVFAPRYAEDVPVICYIHGGSSHGGNALPKNDATNIVKKSIAKGTPVAVVTVNYRLLPSAGLLESSQPQEGDHPRQADDRINWGLYDQKMALEWVRKHIHNFGGNPNEITLMGHSSGASPGGYHLMTAQHEGLFKRAIMHSVSGPTDASERGDSTQTIPERRMTLSSQLSAVADQGTKSDSKKFTFMSDACLPHMTEQERAVGFKVIDHWIDFAWGGGTGKDSISVSA